MRIHIRQADGRAGIGFPTAALSATEEAKNEGRPMKIPLLAALTLVIALGGCASRWNPMNWAGSNSTPDTLEPVSYTH